MDKIFSTSLDEAVLDELNRVTRRLGVTKRRFLEGAIRLHARQSGTARDAGAWAETLGAWRRRESAPTLARPARRGFRQSFERHHRRA